MDEDIVSLFGPDEPTERQPWDKQKNKNKEKRRQKQDAQDASNFTRLVERSIRTGSEMDTLLGLFDPSLEDETTSDIDDLNSDCLLSCYKTSNNKPKTKLKKKDKRRSSPAAASCSRSNSSSRGDEGYRRRFQKKKQHHEVDASTDASTTTTISSGSGGGGGGAGVASPCTALNNATNITDTAKRKSSINMLDKYNDWATQKQAHPRSSVVSTLTAPLTNNKKTKNTNVTNGYNNINSNNTKNNNKKLSQRRSSKNVDGSLVVRRLAPALVNTANEVLRGGDASCGGGGGGGLSVTPVAANTQLKKDCNIKRINDHNTGGAYDSLRRQSNAASFNIGNINIMHDQQFNRKNNNNVDSISSRSITSTGLTDNYSSSNTVNNNKYHTSSTNLDPSTDNNIQRELSQDQWALDIREDCNGEEGCEEWEDGPLPDHLPSEPQEGNIEYKLKLISPNQERFKRLVSQMQWRLREGLGEAIYEIGVEDSGLLLGLTPDELSMSMATLRRMARQLGASLTVIREKSIGEAGGRRVAEVLVRKVPDDQYSIELRVAVLGSSDVGKSTLLGVLTRGQLDNGRGCARLNVFRHRHEVYSGKTSSISIQTMGFDSNGNVVDGTCTRSRDYDDEDICSQSSKIVNFIDLAGDQRYLHTTAFGLSGYCPHYALLVVSAFCGLSAMAEEHLSLARAVELPLLLVVTKTDLATPQQLQHTLASLRTALTAPPHKKVPLVVQTSDDAITAGSGPEGAVVPIFLVSSVTGEGLDLLKQFLFVLPPKMTAKEREKSEQEGAHFQVDEVFHVEERVVVGGLLMGGVIPHGTTLLLGPFDDCDFRAVTVESIHRNKVPCRVVCAGQSASLCLAGHDTSAIRKGMKLLAPETKPTAAYYFQARVSVVSGECGVGRGCELTAHIGNVRQTVVVAGVLGKDRVRTTDTQPSSVLLRFLRQPEFVSVGSRLLLRQGTVVQGVGQLQQVFGERPHTVLKFR